MKKLERGERSEPYEVQTHSLSGEKRMLHVRCNVLGSIHDQSKEYLFMVTDITDEKTAFEKISQSERKYRAIIESSVDNVYICDADTGQVLESNDSMQKLLGYSNEEMKKLTAFDFLDHPKEDVQIHIGKVLSQKNYHVKDRRYRRFDGSLVDIEASCSFFHLDGRDLICVVSRDMTQRNDYEKKLIEERKRAELYLDILSHDIGNLHMGIMGFAKLCKLSGDDPVRLRVYIDNIDIMTSRSIHLVENVMIMSKMSSRKPKMSNIDLTKIIYSCIESIKRSFPGKNVRFDLDLENTKPIWTFPAIESVFYNIIHNAVKYDNNNDTVVEISTRTQEGGSILVMVRDHGPGIPPGMRYDIFNRATLNKKQGGLGLSIVKMLVESCGGRVWIEDPPDGKEGTLFKVEMLTYD
jgi:PAS domain S-box-containing protein